MSDAHHPPNTCINCGRAEDELPVSAWHMGGQTFWLCPDCLPLLIHRRAEVMPKWGLTPRSASSPTNSGA
jgi:hypothetical protein